MASPTNADQDADIQHRKSLMANEGLQNEDEFVKSSEEADSDEESKYEQQHTNIPVPGTAGAGTIAIDSDNSSPYRSYMNSKFNLLLSYFLNLTAFSQL